MSIGDIAGFAAPPSTELCSVHPGRLNESPYSKAQKNDYRDAEAVQHPTMKFVATKTAD
jgi:hypothetical protein